MPTTAVSTAEFLGLVADPQRWHILSELARSDRRVSELIDLTGKPQNLVSYHLGQLRSAGLITSRRSSADGRDTYYRAELHRCLDMFRGATASLHPAIELVPAAPPEPTPGARKPRVLFLCTGNSARSQMAEALLEARSGGAIEARSAGSNPKDLHPRAVEVMAARGIDIAGNQTKHLSRFSRTRFDRVVTLCDKVREICPEFPGQPVSAHWSMADPAGDDAALPAFLRTADEIEERVALLIAQLAAHSRQEHA